MGPPAEAADARATRVQAEVAAFNEEAKLQIEVAPGLAGVFNGIPDERRRLIAKNQLVLWTPSSEYACARLRSEPSASHVHCVVPPIEMIGTADNIGWVRVRAIAAGVEQTLYFQEQELVRVANPRRNEDKVRSTRKRRRAVRAEEQ